MLPLWQWPCSSLERRRHMAELDKVALEALVRQVLLESWALPRDAAADTAYEVWRSPPYR